MSDTPSLLTPAPAPQASPWKAVAAPAPSAAPWAAPDASAQEEASAVHKVVKKKAVWKPLDATITIAAAANKNGKGKDKKKSAKTSAKRAEDAENEGKKAKAVAKKTVKSQNTNSPVIRSTISPEFEEKIDSEIQKIEESVKRVSLVEEQQPSRKSSRDYNYNGYKHRNQRNGFQNYNKKGFQQFPPYPFVPVPQFGFGYSPFAPGPNTLPPPFSPHSPSSESDQSLNPPMFNPYNAYAFPPPNGQFPVIDERLGYVTNQLRYYFSLENLLKDMYLRKNMDSEGYVLLGVINDFHRMKSLSGGALVVLQEAVKYVPELEMVWDREEDGILVGAKIRLREQWENWVIPS